MNADALQVFVSRAWDESIVPQLLDYIRIPCKSPAFDPQWREHGHIDRAVALVERWCREQDVAQMHFEVLRLEGRTPLIFMDIPGSAEGCVLLYGHLDKQPEMSGWRDGLGPWTPVLERQRLYGRGGADDGYAVFASLTAVRALAAQHRPHARCVILIEACEESASYDLPHYIDALADRIGAPDLVICLDSGCGNYDQLWCTTSLRGIVAGTLHVEILEEGVHSGNAGGVVPSSFRIARQLLSRIEDERTGWIQLPECHVPVPSARAEQAARAAAALGEGVAAAFPFVAGARPAAPEPMELVLNRSWRPALEVTGADGLPPLANAGNVHRPRTALKLSLRIPPTADAHTAAARLRQTLEAQPPYGAKVHFQPERPAPGWNAPALSAWLASAIDSASRTFFGREALYMGEGGTIPFMGMLGEKFPEAQFLVTGVLGPHSNAHGPNEFLDIPTGKKVTACIAQVLHAHASRKQTPSDASR